MSPEATRYDDVKRRGAGVRVRPRPQWQVDGYRPLLDSVTPLYDGERLSRDSITLEGRVLDEVPEDRVSSTPGQAVPVEVRRADAFGKRSVQRPKGLERVEHFAVPARTGPATLDDVRPVGPVPTDRPGELPFLAQRVRELGAQPSGTGRCERVFGGAESEFDGVAAIRAIDGDRWIGRCAISGGEFLDQECGRSVSSTAPIVRGA